MSLSAANALSQDRTLFIPIPAKPAATKPFAPLSDISPSSSNFVTNTDTAVDNSTGLEWQRFDDQLQSFDFSEATSFCSFGFASGFWRVPTIEEYLTIIDFESTLRGFVSIFGTGEAFYWSSTMSAGTSRSSGDDIQNGWVVRASNGEIIESTVDTRHGVLCVRDV